MVVKSFVFLNNNIYTMKILYCLLIVMTNIQLHAQGYEAISGKAFTAEITGLKPGDTVDLTHEQSKKILKHRIHKIQDLNDDGVLDIITVQAETCGNRGDCVYSIFVQLKQKPGTFQCLFSEYLYRYKESGKDEIEGQKWSRFDTYGRTNLSGLVDSVNPLIKVGELRFNGKLYEISYKNN